MDVIYSRAADSVRLRLIPGNPKTTVTNPETGIQIRIGQRSYAALPEELVFDGQTAQFWPMAGDLITEADGTVYEVVRKKGAEYHFDWFDAREEVLSLFTQLVLGT